MRETFVIVGAGLTGGIQVDLARLRDEAIQVRDLASG